MPFFRVCNIINIQMVILLLRLKHQDINLISIKVEICLKSWRCFNVKISTSYQPRLKFGWNPDVVSTSGYQPHINQGQVWTSFQPHINQLWNLVRISTSYQSWSGFQGWNNVMISTSGLQPHSNLISTRAYIWLKYWRCFNVEMTLTTLNQISTWYQPDFNQHCLLGYPIKYVSFIPHILHYQWNTRVWDIACILHGDRLGWNI